MRIWTLHPRLLDPRGLVALWREALLAQAVLHGRTRGYTKHPQLERFIAAPHPRAAIGSYLDAVHEESVARGYTFDRSRIMTHDVSARLTETRGQLAYEWEHFVRKVQARNGPWFHEHCADVSPGAHPLFRLTKGGVRHWERYAE